MRAGAGLGRLIGASFLSAFGLLGDDVCFETEQGLGHRGAVLLSALQLLFLHGAL